MANIRSPFKRVLLLATTACMLFLAVEGTQIMHRPAGYKNPARTFAKEASPKINKIERRASGKASFAYFTNWGIYGANFRKILLPCSSIRINFFFFFRAHQHRRLLLDP
jgi:chitinase